jgi:Tol biopolymer transport system component
VYYENLTTFQVFRVSIDGGVPEEVPGTRGLSNVPAMGLSSDGKFLVSFKLRNDVVPPGGKIATGAKIAIVPLDAGPKPEVRYLDAEPRLAGQAKFTPDREAVIYIIRDNNSENLWRQPLDGSAGRQITNFQGDGILTYVFSPDGKTLGIMRTHIESDLVLLHDTASSSQVRRGTDQK